MPPQWPVAPGATSSVTSRASRTRRSRISRSRGSWTSCSTASSRSSTSTLPRSCCCEEDGRTLVPRAAKGLEEEVQRRVRIGVGKGFAGRIAGTRKAVRITDLDHAEIVNPLLREKGIKSLLGVPLIVEGAVIGVLHVGSLDNRVFTDDDVDLLMSAGDRAALAIRGRLDERERGLADAIQASLMPTLPEMPGVGLEGRYLPAASAKLGGDWFDAFPLPGGRLGMTIGDVSGRGFQAAALMGQLRSGLRAYAMDRASPADVVERLNNLLRQLEPGRNATLIYLVLDPQEGSLLLCGAGHPPPLVMHGGRIGRVPGAARLGPAGGGPLRALRGGGGPARAGRVAPALHGRDRRAPRRAARRGPRAAARRGLPAGTSRPRRCATRSCGAMLPEGSASDDAALLVARALTARRSARAAPPRRRGHDPAAPARARALAPRGGGHDRRDRGDLARVLGGLRERDRARLRARAGRARGDAPRSPKGTRPSSACATSGAGGPRAEATAAAGWS